jgi:hypothetical protein
MKLEINSRKEIGNSTNLWKFSNMLFNNLQVKEVTREISILRKMSMKTQHTKICAAKAV